MPPSPPLPVLPMQLALSLGCWLSSPSAWRCVKSALPPSKIDPRRLESALAGEAKSRANDFLSGILRYLETPTPCAAEEPPAIWQKGNARLLDYGGDGPLVLFIPSLINRYYILDLEENRSLLRYLAAQGVRPLVLDWGVPGSFEKNFDCEDYLTEILLPAVDFLHKSSGSKITLAGYCMGGVLALAAAQLKPKQVGRLALLATPWDFHCKEFSPFVVGAKWRKTIASLIGSRKTLPASVVQSLFYMTDPFVFEHKFRRFAGLEKDSRAARDFVALERWVNDGVPMTAPLARDCLIGWAQENRLHNKRWKVAGKTIDPAKLKIPAFIAMPKNDHVVPRDCAAALAAAMPRAGLIEPGSGHVGMIVGRNAKKELWEKLAEWLDDAP